MHESDFMIQKESNFPIENWAKDTNWQYAINLNNTLIINMKMFQYTSDQKCKLLQYSPYYASERQVVQRIKVPRDRRKCVNEYFLPESTRV